MGIAFFGGLNGAVLLIALALGYIVCCLANKETKLLRKVGYLIGIIIIATSSILILAKFLWLVNMHIKTCSMRSHHQILREQALSKMPTMP